MTGQGVVKHSEYVRRLNISWAAPFKRNRRESPVTALNRKLSHLDEWVSDVREKTYHRKECCWRMDVKCSKLENFKTREANAHFVTAAKSRDRSRQDFRLPPTNFGEIHTVRLQLQQLIHIIPPAGQLDTTYTPSIKQYS